MCSSTEPPPDQMLSEHFQMDGLQISPAESPQIVTFEGSPPSTCACTDDLSTQKNATRRNLTYFCIHSKAARWSTAESLHEIAGWRNELTKTGVESSVLANGRARKKSKQSQTVLEDNEDNFLARCLDNVIARI